MWKIIALTVVLTGVGCAPASQPESIRTAAAAEIHLKTTADRIDLISMIRRHAADDGGLHVDDVTNRWRQFEAQTGKLPPEQRGTIFVGVWRGSKDDDPEADVGDSGHPHRAWITFETGRDPIRSAKFRNGLLAEINRRWPDTQQLPILPSGGLALVDDLRMTAAGYKIEPAAAKRYELPRSSLLLARD